MRVLMRSSLPPASVTGAVTRALADVDPRIGVSYGVLTTDIRETVVRERLLATLSGGFGILAAILTLAGLYGLIAYTVTRRTSEIGVRMALGAGRAAIARLMLRETGSAARRSARCSAPALALAGGRAAATLLFGVRPYDPALLLLALRRSPRSPSSRATHRPDGRHGSNPSPRCAQIRPGSRANRRVSHRVVRVFPIPRLGTQSVAGLAHREDVARRGRVVL